MCSSQSTCRYPGTRLSQSKIYVHSHPPINCLSRPELWSDLHYLHQSQVFQRGLLQNWSHCVNETVKQKRNPHELFSLTSWEIFTRVFDRDTFPERIFSCVGTQNCLEVPPTHTYPSGTSPKSSKTYKKESKWPRQVPRAQIRYLKIFRCHQTFSRAVALRRDSRVELRESAENTTQPERLKKERHNTFQDRTRIAKLSNAGVNSIGHQGVGWYYNKTRDGLVGRIQQ